MSYLFLAYPKCNTCRNAKKWLDEHKITYEDRHIIDRNPSVEELTSDGKLIKRPLLISENQVLVGFKADEWNNLVK